MIPKELTHLLEKYSEDQLNLCITQIDYSMEDLIINFLLSIEGTGDDDEILQNWIITATNPRKDDLHFDYGSYLAATRQHPLLLEFTDMQCQLYFSGQCKDIPKLFFDLYQDHHRFYGQYKIFDIEFEQNTTALSAPLTFENKLLSEGPKTLMLKYAESLKRNDLDFRIIGETQAMYWDGEEHIPETNNLFVLFFNKGHIIAEKFDFTKND